MGQCHLGIKVKCIFWRPFSSSMRHGEQAFWRPTKIPLKPGAPSHFHQEMYSALCCRFIIQLLLRGAYAAIMMSCDDFRQLTSSIVLDSSLKTHLKFPSLSERY